MSSTRRRGLVRLGILLGSIAALAVVGINVVSGSSGGGESGQSARAQSRPTGPGPLTGKLSRARLPTALHGESVAQGANGLLVIGGEDSAGSTDRVYRLDPAAGKFSLYGSLAQPLHDAAAASIDNHETLVFGGGNTSTLDSIQALTPGGTARTVGHLPATVSDLSAVHVAGAAYILGGYDGRSPSASVLQTTNGQAFTRVARLPTPVRYGAAATIGEKIYVFGGELADGSDTDEIQEYDIATERAVVAGHLPDPVSHASAVTLNGAIYLLGGRVGGTASDRILRFDPNRNAGIPAGRLPAPVFDGAAGSYAGHGFLIGGLGAAGSALDSVIELR